MDFAALKRDAAAINAACPVVEGGKVWITTAGCRIYVPCRYETHKLMTVGDEIRILGIFAIVVGEGAQARYGISSAIAMLTVTPSSTAIIKIQGDDYYELSFDPGAEICGNLDLVKNDSLVFPVYDEFVAKGHIPAFFSYEDMCTLFISSERHAAMRLDASNAVLEMIVGSIARHRDDRTIYYRQTLTEDAALKVPPAYIAFRNVIYGATSTVSKLLGSYMDDGMMSALVNPSEKVEGIESLLRM